MIMRWGCSPFPLQEMACSLAIAHAHITFVSLLMQKVAPVNFVDEDHDADEIRNPKDFDNFVKLKLDQAKQLTRAKQASK